MPKFLYDGGLIIDSFAYLHPSSVNCLHLKKVNETCSLHVQSAVSLQLHCENILCTTQDCRISIWLIFDNYSKLWYYMEWCVDWAKKLACSKPAGSKPALASSQVMKPCRSCMPLVLDHHLTAQIPLLFTAFSLSYTSWWHLPSHLLTYLLWPQLTATVETESCEVYSD